jgi:hypothetical protein
MKDSVDAGLVGLLVRNNVKTYRQRDITASRNVVVRLTETFVRNFPQCFQCGGGVNLL